MVVIFMQLLFNDYVLLAERDFVGYFAKVAQLAIIGVGTSQVRMW